MKGFLSTACLLALLLFLSSCDGALGRLTDAMRTGWTKIRGTEKPRDPRQEMMEALAAKIPPVGQPSKNELAAAARLESVPGPPLSEMEKVMVVRATKLGNYHNSRAYQSQVFQLVYIGINKQYESLQTEESIAPKDLTKFCDPPAEIGQMRFMGSKITPLDDPYTEELIPYVPLYNNREYKKLELSYHNVNPGGYGNHFTISDRSYWPEWAKTAAWYYMRKGYIRDRDRFAGAKFVGVKERSNHAWVVWHWPKDGWYRFQTLWNDTYMIEFGGRSVEDVALVDKIRIRE